VGGGKSKVFVAGAHGGIFDTVLRAVEGAEQKNVVLD
jgi:tripartite-type tricarboxylate transporter receptor subunit TctC